MENLRAVVRAAVELTSQHDGDAVLDVILGELDGLVPYDMASVLALDGERLRVVAARGLRRDVDLASLSFALGANPRLDRALQARGTVRFTNPDEPDPFDDVAGAQLEHIHSCMAAPLRLRGRVMGLITADAYAQGRFGPADEEKLELFAALAAVAIRNAQLVSDLERARAQLEGEVQTLADEIRDDKGGTQIIGEAPPTRALRDEIHLVGATDTTVLVVGETGTGKELVARALHAASPRRDRPLIRFDCSGVAPTLIESELFGHAKGAFTGATQARAGRFEVADGGTLFLDEIGELPLDAQPRLLRALQEREVERVGEVRVRRFDVRVIAATNRDLAGEVRAGRFRADLFHRLAVYPIRVPQLAERLGDLPELVQHFARKLSARLGLGGVALDEGFLEALRGYAWPGNVRELGNLVERALVRGRALGRRTVRLDDAAARLLGLAGAEDGERAAAPARPAAGPGGQTLGEATRTFQLQVIEQALAEADGNLAAAARALGEDRANLYRRLRRLRRDVRAGAREHGVAEVRAGEVSASRTTRSGRRVR